ncbi:MAG TPA: hypothetical protein VHC70_12005 [Phycisphaerales bacterium]|nr:hypothetical protein [Phycisphaerales bacterium]
MTTIVLVAMPYLWTSFLLLSALSISGTVFLLLNSCWRAIVVVLRRVHKLNGYVICTRCGFSDFYGLRCPECGYAWSGKRRDRVLLASSYVFPILGCAGSTYIARQILQRARHGPSSIGARLFRFVLFVAIPFACIGLLAERAVTDHMSYGDQRIVKFTCTGVGSVIGFGVWMSYEYAMTARWMFAQVRERHARLRVGGANDVGLGEIRVVP